MVTNRVLQPIPCMSENEPAARGCDAVHVRMEKIYTLTVTLRVTHRFQPPKLANACHASAGLLIEIDTSAQRDGNDLQQQGARGHSKPP